MMTYSNTRKVCATCSYWSGNRTVSSGRDRVETNDSSARCIGGGRNNCNCLRDSTCPKYDKLKQLR